MRAESRARVFTAAIAIFSLVFAGHTAGAQQMLQTPAGSQIIVSGSAEVMVPPAKAAFSVGIMTSAPSAATAGEDNARISKGVLAALERVGLKHEEISGTRLGVRPRLEYDDKGRHPMRIPANMTVHSGWT